MFILMFLSGPIFLWSLFRKPEPTKLEEDSRVEDSQLEDSQLEETTQLLRLIHDVIDKDIGYPEIMLRMMTQVIPGVQENPGQYARDMVLLSQSILKAYQ